MSLPNDFLVKPSMCLERIKDRNHFFPVSVHTPQLSRCFISKPTPFAFRTSLSHVSSLQFLLHHITCIVSLSTQTSTQLPVT